MKDPKSPVMRLKAHAKKIATARKQIAIYKRRVKLTNTILRKWLRRLSALEAASARVGMPAGKKREPKQLTQAEFDAIDQAFID